MLLLDDDVLVEPDLGDIAERDHAFAALFQRKRIDVLNVFNETGNLDVEPALAAVEKSGRNQLVVLLERIEELIEELEKLIRRCPKCLKCPTER